MTTATNGVSAAACTFCAGRGTVADSAGERAMCGGCMGTGEDVAAPDVPARCAGGKPIRSGDALGRCFDCMWTGKSQCPAGAGGNDGR